MSKALIKYWCKTPKDMESLEEISLHNTREQPHSSNCLIASLFLQGSNLDDLSKEIDAIREKTDQTDQQLLFDPYTITQQAILSLQGLIERPTRFLSQSWHQDQQLQLMKKNQLNLAFYLYYITQLQFFYLFEDYENALKIVHEFNQEVQSFIGLLGLAECHFYYSLTLAAWYINANEQEQQEVWKILTKNLAQFKHWSTEDAANFAHKSLLIQAEMSRLSGHVLEAMELYDQAIASAEENGFIQNQAIANELAAKFYLRHGRKRIAQTYMTEAYHAYSHWGAVAKTRDLEQKYPQLVLTILQESAASAHLKKLLQTQIELTQAYSRFVPKEFLQFLGKTSIIDVDLGNQVQLEMSVLFADICDFTTLSEQMTPEENFRFINSYFSRMESVITENRGFIDKYIGDSIMALFNGAVNDAVNAAIAMIHKLTEFNRHRAELNQSQIKIGIGINTGSLMLGTVGGANRMDSTVISDAVNLSARIEKLTREYEVTLLISHHTLAQLNNPEQYCIRMIDQVKVKGKSELVTVYEVFDADPPDLRDGKFLTAATFTQALSLFNERRYREATRLLETCLDSNPRDKVARIYLERCLKSGLHLMQEL